MLRLFIMIDNPSSGGVTPGGGGLYSAYIQIEDRKAQNTSGGTFTAGSWQKRDLNTEVADTGNNAAVASNQITLEAGTYLVFASAPAFIVNRHQLRLQNVTDGTTLAVGQSNHAAAGTNVNNIAVLAGRFTISEQKVLELQHQCETSAATRGLGVEGNFGAEVYAQIQFWKES
jgi:hypothetical protein